MISIDIVKTNSFITSTMDDFKKTLISLCNQNEDSRKKAELITYWLRDYKKYLEFEDIFTPKKLKSYKRGDVLKVNLGFNIGNEEGGLHYAVVIDNDNAQSSGIITIVPLSSIKKNENLSKYNVPLGNELYIKLNKKFNDLNNFCKSEIARISKEIEKCKLQDCRSCPENNLGKSSCGKITKQQNDLKKVQIEVIHLEKINREIKKMKIGTKALVGQVTTISKMRIFDPKVKYDILSGIRISPKNLDLITLKLKELYLFNVDKNKETEYNNKELENNAV